MRLDQDGHQALSRADDIDRKASAAIDRVYADPVVWRPMRVRSGQRVTQRADDITRNADPDRQPRGLDQKADPFVAIITWRDSTIDSSTNDSEHAGVPANDVLLDFARDVFQWGGVWSYPVAGDLFELLADDGTSVIVQLPRAPIDDGSWRIQCYCTAPE